MIKCPTLRKRANLNSRVIIALFKFTIVMDVTLLIIRVNSFSLVLFRKRIEKNRKSIEKNGALNENDQIIKSRVTKI